MWQTLMWTGAPLVALLLAIVWAHLRARPKGPSETADTMGEYARFCAAIVKPIGVPAVPEQRTEVAPREAKAS